MIEIAMSTLKKKFLTLKNFLWLFSIFACIQYLDEFLESLGVTLENTIFDYVFDGIQILFIGIAIYIFLSFVEKNVQNSLLKDSFLRAVIENMDEGVSVCDKDGNLVFLNNTSSQRINQDSLPFPIPYEQWSRYWDFYEDNGEKKVNPKDENLPLLRALRGETVKHQELVFKPIGKPMQFLSFNGKQIASKSGEILGALVVVHDITEKKQTEEKIKYMAYHDNLTGLPNLRFFKDKVTFLLAEGDQNNNSTLFAIMFLDLDGFKAVNDHFGHDVGDLLLKGVSQRITDCLRESDIASRIGGDKFTILIPEIETEEDAIVIANSIIEEVGSPYDIQGSKLQVTTSIGITFLPHDGTDRRTLLKNADIAMYTAKKNGKNQYCVFSGQKTA
jgi:diguanylate cyclase (GGDEF)-like protein